MEIVDTQPRKPRRAVRHACLVGVSGLVWLAGVVCASEPRTTSDVAERQESGIALHLFWMVPVPGLTPVSESTHMPAHPPPVALSIEIVDPLSTEIEGIPLADQPPPQPDPIPMTDELAQITIDHDAVLSTADFAALPVIRRRQSIWDGDDEQMALALAPVVVKNTKRKQNINSYFVNPPDTRGQVITLRDVLISTLKTNPDIAISFWRTEDASFAIRAAKAPLLPQVEVGAASGIEGVYSEGVARASLLQRSEATLRVSQTLFDFGRTGLAIQRAKALHQSQLLQRQDAIDEAVFGAIASYLDLLGTEQLVESASDNVAAHERIVALVEKSFQAGNLSEAEVKRARTRLDRARTSLLDFENRRERAIGNFRRVTGLDPGVLVEPELKIERADRLTADTADQFLQHSPVLQSALRDINSLDHQITAANRANLPEVSLQVAGAVRENVLGNESWSTDTRAMLATTWQAYDGGAASARKSQLIARKREAEAVLRGVRDELRQDALNIISVLETSREKRLIFTEQLEASERVVELYAKQFEAGRRSLLDLLDAQADFAAAREESIANKYEHLVAALASIRVQNDLIPMLNQDLGLSQTVEALTGE